MSNLKVGDLAYIAHPMKCCGARPSHGLFVTIKGFCVQDPLVIWACLECGKIADIDEPLAEVETSQGLVAVEVYRLKKVDPPALEDSETKEMETI